MGQNILNFSRYEKKYLLTAEQYRLLSEKLEEYFVPDHFYHSTVCSLYYDDENYSLIRSSIEGPVFKEKLRIRSYGLPSGDDSVFVELKMKYKGTVYKRRVELEAAQAQAWLAGQMPAPDSSVTHREIDAILSKFSLFPRAYIVCDRLALAAKTVPQLRVTFDRSIRYRDYDLDIFSGLHGQELLKDGSVLMEIKMPLSAPLWLARMLSELGIFPTSFSKYGTCYRQELLTKHFLQNV